MCEKKYGCIYSITNLKNNKVYIGQTRNFEKRKKDHLRELINKKHGNCSLLKDFQEGNQEDFVFKIIRHANSREELDKLEDKYILKHGYPDTNKIYNIKRGGIH